MYLVSADQIVLVAVYVGDILLCSTEDVANTVTAHLEAKFNCVNLGEISLCLGMRIHTSPCRHIITLDLDQYVQTILARYKFDQLTPAPTPMLHDRRLTKEDCSSTDAEKLAM